MSVPRGMAGWLVIGLVVLGANVAIDVLVGLVLAALFFRGDPVLAAVPALFALPGILLQPWFVLSLALPGGLLLAPIPTTIVTVPLYMVLDRRGRLDRAKRVLRRLQTRSTAVALVGVAACLLAVGVARWFDFPPLRRGVPPSLRGSLATDLATEVADSRYYCMGDFIDSEWLWQARLPEHDLATLAERLRLQPVDPATLGDAFRRRPPYWWRPVVTPRTRVLATPAFPVAGRGPDGLHALATWDPETGVLHMWVKDNF